MSTFKNENSLRTIEAQIVQKLKNNETWPKLTGSYKKKPVYAIETLCFPSVNFFDGIFHLIKSGVSHHLC